MASYFEKPVCNGNAREQSQIRRWWNEQHNAAGLLVWEYHLEGYYVDAIWFPELNCRSVEEPGTGSRFRFPIKDMKIVLCEAKRCLNPALIGQAIVYTELAMRAGASVQETVVFAESARMPTIEIAQKLGLKTVIHPITVSAES
jgi:hypothetical protein